MHRNDCLVYDRTPENLPGLPPYVRYARLALGERILDFLAAHGGGNPRSNVITVQGDQNHIRLELAKT
jgi:hypothetical protein